MPCRSPTSAKFVANSLKTVLRFKDLVVDEKLNMIVVRDTPSAIAMAEKLVAMHDGAQHHVRPGFAALEGRDVVDPGIALPVG